jgi:CarD family transcriptional regulator
VVLARSRAKSAERQGVWLEVGDAIRYQGLGSGRVVRLETRDLKGEKRVFAVIEFPHRDLSTHVPLGDDRYTNKLRPVLAESAAKRLLAIIKGAGDALSRTWDDREESGNRSLREGSPVEWAEMLRDYATARRGGMAITSSDADLVRETIDLLAAEYACACLIEFSEALAIVNGAYSAPAA